MQHKLYLMSSAEGIHFRGQARMDSLPELYRRLHTMMTDDEGQEFVEYALLISLVTKTE